MKVTVLLFAGLRELVGKERLELDLAPETPARDVLPLIWVTQKIPCSLSFAINQRYVGPETALQEGDVLALIPPVAGG